MNGDHHTRIKQNALTSPSLANFTGSNRDHPLCLPRVSLPFDEVFASSGLEHSYQDIESFGTGGLSTSLPVEETASSSPALPDVSCTATDARRLLIRSQLLSSRI